MLQHLLKKKKAKSNEAVCFGNGYSRVLSGQTGGENVVDTEQVWAMWACKPKRPSRRLTSPSGGFKEHLTL